MVSGCGLCSIPKCSQLLPLCSLRKGKRLPYLVRAQVLLRAPGLPTAIAVRWSLSSHRFLPNTLTALQVPTAHKANKGRGQPGESMPNSWLQVHLKRSPLLSVLLAFLAKVKDNGGLLKGREDCRMVMKGMIQAAGQLWCRSRLSPQYLGHLEVRILEGGWVIGVLYSAVDSFTDEFSSSVDYGEVRSGEWATRPNLEGSVSQPGPSLLSLFPGCHGIELPFL